MGLYNNTPTFSYVHVSGVTVVWCGELYTVQDFSTNKKYVYWTSSLPNQLNASNVMPNRSASQYLVLVNDNGIATEVPSTSEDFSISYDGNSTQAIRDRIFGLYEKNNQFGEKFVAIEQDINGIKQIIGDGGVGGEDYDHDAIWEKISVIEQKADEIDLSVKENVKKYNDDKETNKLREDLNSSIIKLNSTLGTFKGELTDYFKNNEITSEEKVKIETQLGILTNEKTVLDGLVDTVKLIAEKNNQTQNVVAIESAKQALQIAHDNLYNNITNAVIDSIITPTENTIITDAFAKYNLRISELKQTCDDIIILGLGGVITEELANINIKSDEIKLSVSKVESDFKSDMSVQKIELESQIKDISTALGNFENTVNTTFKDGIIDQAEKQLLQEKIDLVDKEKLDIDLRYRSLTEDSNLSTSMKTQLTDKYNDYCNKHNQLIEKINYIISDDMVNDAEKLEVNTLFKSYSNALAYISALMSEALEDISYNTAKVELEEAKGELQNSINGVRDSIEGIDKVLDGTFENNILDEVERENIKQNLENLSREKLDIDKTYTELYENIYLTGQDKIDLKNSYDNYVSKYNEVVTVSNSILEKEELVNNIDRANMNSATTKHKEALALFHTQANKSIDVVATNKVNSAKNEINTGLNGLKSQVEGLNTYVDNTFKNNIIDDAERKAISQNIETLNMEKADVDKTYESIYSNSYLTGQLKTDLKNSYDNFISKHSATLSVIQGILDKTTLINDADRENMSKSFTDLKNALSTFIYNANESSKYITTKSIESAKNTLQQQIDGANNRIDKVISDVNGAISDGIIDEAESITIADNINRLNKEKLELDSKYEAIYNNSDLDGSLKTNLAKAKTDFNSKFTLVINTINQIVEDKKVTDEEKLEFENAINSYNTSFANLVKQLDLCVDYIAEKKVNNASSLLTKELQELEGALGGLEETMNGTFKDGVLSDAEKSAIKQNLKTLETGKLNVDKQYTVVYNNTSLTGTAKTGLKSSYDNYVSKYNSLVTVINNILNKTGLLVEADNTALNNAFREHNTAMSSYNEKINVAIDYISTKNVENAKKELSSNISELNVALNSLESTMNNAFKDGVLSEAEKSSIKQHLLSVSSKKTDIDKRYANLYANEHLEGSYKSNLTSAYNNYVNAYNSLVVVINNILEKEGLVDSSDQTNLNNAFKEHDNKLGLYSTADLNALDAIAKKKVSDLEEKTNKKISEIVITTDSITTKVESLETTTTTLTDNLNKVTNTANNSIKSVDVLYYLSTSETSLQGGSWVTVAPQWVNGKYMWSKTRTTLSNGTVKESSPTCISGAKGDTGASGLDGKGVKAITNYYLASSSSTGVTTSTSGWTTGVQSPSSSKKYLWNYEKITYTDNSSTSTTPCIIGNYSKDGINGTNGTNGTNGKDGKGIVSITEYYLVSPNATGVTTSTSGWNTTIPSMTSTNRYLWNYEKTAYTTGEVETGSPKVIGVYGDKGDTGASGTNGVGISKIENFYLASTSNSGVTTNTSGWTTTVQSVTSSKKYLWNYEKITYTNNTSSSTEPCIIGAYGDKGATGSTGATGVGIKSIVEYYAISNSNTTAPTSWSTTMQNTTTSNKYLWNYELITYTDNTTTTTTKKVIGTHGATGSQGEKGDKGDSGKGVSSIVNYYLATNSSSGVTTSTSGWTTTVQSVSSSKKYLWNYEKVSYTDSTYTSTTPCIIGAYGDKGTNGTNGTNGVDGVGIKSITEYYLVSPNNSGVTTSTSGWTTTIQTMTATNKYLWNYEKITYTNDTTKIIEPRIIGTYGDKGDTGKGVKSIANYYLVSPNQTGVTVSTTGWTTTVQSMTSTNKYLWNYEKVTYTDDTYVNTTPCIIGNYAKDGTNGTNGTNGKGISSIVEYYLVSANSSGITTSTSGWSTNIPTMTATNKYLWNYEKITYTTGEVTTGTPKIIGVYGDKGNTGATGQGIDSITEEYYLSTSKTTQTGGSWSTTPPTWSNGKYIWTRSKIVYKNPASTVYTTPICDSSWEAVNDIEIGGTNLIRKSNIIKNSNQATYDDNTNTWTITALAGSGGTWGSGLRLSGTNVVIPYGKTYTLSFEIKVPRDCSWNIDVNNYAVSGDSWGGNDNDNTSIRKTNSKSLSSGQWIKCWSQFSNTNTNNTNKVDIYDASNFGVVMQDETSDMTYYIRNIQGELGNVASEWSPAPEDVQTQIDTNKTEISTTKNKVATIETTVGSITSKVTNLETTTTTINGQVSNINTRLNTAEQKITDSSITQVVENSQLIKDINGKITTNTSNISKIDQKADSISLSVSGKVDSSSIISSINMSPETIKIKADKINITGYVTFSDLSSSGSTTINGSNITTGTLNASLIKTGTLNASLINVTNLSASSITTGTLSGNRISGGTLEGTLLRTYAHNNSQGVRIKSEGIDLNDTSFHFADSRFKIEAVQNMSISSMANIYLMPGLKQDGTPDPNKERLVFVSGKVACESLTVNGVQITGNGGVAVFG